MKCPQPHQSLLLLDTPTLDDEWLQENWIEEYWFAYDQAKAIEMMLQNKENNSLHFMKYLSKLKYHN
ncbi:hypothetical protein CEXT_15921 [Caerostris extrusa]|nr:hypothetical protein CEXT_15921 [Caerostris extrusa]